MHTVGVVRVKIKKQVLSRESIHAYACRHTRLNRRGDIQCCRIVDIHTVGVIMVERIKRKEV